MQGLIAVLPVEPPLLNPRNGVLPVEPPLLNQHQAWTNERVP
jgi:hypothetical protein